MDGNKMIQKAECEALLISLGFVKSPRGAYIGQREYTDPENITRALNVIYDFELNTRTREFSVEVSVSLWPLRRVKGCGNICIEMNTLTYRSKDDFVQYLNNLFTRIERNLKEVLFLERTA